MSVNGVVLALFALVVVAVIAYRAGYLLGQAELLHQGQPTEAEWNALRMTSVLPRWRRVAGWAAYVSVCPGLGVDLFDGGMGSLVHHLPRRDRARRVVLEAPSSREAQERRQ